MTEKACPTRGRPGWRWTWALAALSIAAEYSALDEIHQAFVASLLDSSGAFVASVVIPVVPLPEVIRAAEGSTAKSKAWLPPRGNTGTALGAVNCASLPSFPIP